MLEIIKDLQDQVVNASPFVLCVITTIGICYVVKLLPFISNKYIPAICLLFPAVVYTLLTKPTLQEFQQMYFPQVRYFCIGLAAGAIAWITHNKFLKNIESKYFPSNTETENKPNSQ